MGTDGITLIRYHLHRPQNHQHHHHHLDTAPEDGWILRMDGMRRTFDHLHPDQHPTDHGMIRLVDDPGGEMVLPPGVEEHQFDVTTTVGIIIITTIATRIVHRDEIMIHATGRVVGIAISNPMTTTMIMTMTRIKFE